MVDVPNVDLLTLLFGKTRFETVLHLELDLT